MGSLDRQLDRWLDGALRQFGLAEPRSGLESRILATLAMERTANSRTWRWCLVLASVAGLVTVLWLGNGHPGVRKPERISNREIPVGAGNGRVPQLMPRAVNQPAVRKQSSSRRVHEMHASTAVNERRLDQFPSQRPFSRDELLFVSYAKHFPKEATLLAQEQENFEQEIRRAEEEALNGAVSNQER